MADVHEPVPQTKATAAEAVIVQYRTADRWGEEYGVASVHAALEQHPDAEIVRYQDGRPFEGKAAKADIKEAKAEIRAERQERQAATELPSDPPAKAKAKTEAE